MAVVNKFTLRPLNELWCLVCVSSVAPSGRRAPLESRINLNGDICILNTHTIGAHNRLFVFGSVRWYSVHSAQKKIAQNCYYDPECV